MVFLSISVNNLLNKFLYVEPNFNNVLVLQKHMYVQKYYKFEHTVVVHT